MTMSAIGGCSPAQATQYTSTANTSATSSPATASGSARDGSTFISAIASALSDIGVTASSAGGTDPSVATTDPAQALGGFLQNFMQTLHAQNAGTQADGNAAASDAGATQGSAPAHAHLHHGGKGGNLQADLKSQIASLGSTGTDSTASAATTASATTASATADLSNSFKNLLGALGADSSGASAKLGQFLQTLSSKLESSGPSGNLVNTTA